MPDAVPSTERSDDTLVVQAQARDPAAWTELYRRYHPPVYRYVRSRVRDDASAEDLAADVFLQALSSIDRYSQQRPFLAWLYGIAHHIIASHYRSERRRWSFLVPWSRDTDDDDRPIEDLPDPEAGPDRHAEYLDLAAAIDRLTGPQREVIRLRYFAGLATEEIATAMRKDTSAIYSLHARALIRLRADLDEHVMQPPDENRGSRTTTPVTGIERVDRG